MDDRSNPTVTLDGWDDYIVIDIAKVIAKVIAIMHIRGTLDPGELSLLRTPALF